MEQQIKFTSTPIGLAFHYFGIQACLANSAPTSFPAKQQKYLSEHLGEQLLFTQSIKCTKSA
jgi:hypothetical protein